MKKFLMFLLLVISNFSLANDKIIKIASGPTTMYDIANIAKKELEKKGYTVEVKAFSDYVTANKGLQAKEFDVNFHQHKPFMEEFNKKNKASLVKVAAIYDVYVGFYSKKINNINFLPKNATVAIPNDPTNKDRALKMLESANIISLNKKNELHTLKDIIENPKNIVIKELPIPSLGNAYDEFDLVFNWPAHILKRGLNPKKNALILEKQNKNNEFAVIISSRKDNKNSKKVKDIENAFKIKEVKNYLENKYKEQGFPVF